MTSTPIIDMFSDNYGPARKYLERRFPNAETCKDFRDQTVTIGAPCQDLSVAGNAVVRLQRGLTAITNERNL